MIRYFPESALGQLEFDKIRDLLAEKCKSAYAREKAASLSLVRLIRRVAFVAAAVAVAVVAGAVRA